MTSTSRFAVLLLLPSLVLACSEKETQGDADHVGTLDANGDHVADDLGTAYDPNGDGAIDWVDINGDGTLDGPGVDRDGDGVADAVGIDTDGDGIIDSGDFFSVTQALSDLNLQLLRDGNLVAESVSTLDNVEHLHIDVDPHAEYTLRVLGQQVFGRVESFALAWHAVAVPEPAGLVLAMFAALALCIFRHR